MSGSYRQCPECGKRALSIATRCPGCQLELPAPEAPEAAPGRGLARHLVPIAAAGVLATAVVVGLARLGRTDHPAPPPSLSTFTAGSTSHSTEVAGATTAPRDTAATADTTAAAPQQPAGTGSVTITNYEPHHIAMDVEAKGNNFLVVSEIHYPPGWTATIDGKPASIIQTNYLLRGLVDTRHLAYFAVMILAFLVLTKASVESVRWR